MYITLAVLGVSAIDPIGLAAMPLLLLQKHPLRRCFIFLAGSFVSLMIMGLVFAQGFGTAVLHFQTKYPNFVTTPEAAAGILLIGLAIVLFWRYKKGLRASQTPDLLVKSLARANWQLFLAGALLVAVQSVVDVVFLIAMIHIGQSHAHFMTLTAAVATYTIAALLLQLSIVMVYTLSSPQNKQKSLRVVRHLLEKYADQLLIGVSFLLGCVLLWQFI